MGIGAVPQRKDILQTGLRAGHSKASRADLNFTNALREGLFLLALARAAPIARRLVAPPACSRFQRWANVRRPGVGPVEPRMSVMWSGTDSQLVHRNFSV